MEQVPQQRRRSVFGIPTVEQVLTFRTRVKLGYEKIYYPIFQNILDTIPKMIFHGINSIDFQAENEALDSLIRMLDSKFGDSKMLTKGLMESTIMQQQQKFIKFDELWTRSTGKELPTVLLERIQPDQQTDLEIFYQEYKDGIQKVKSSFMFAVASTLSLILTIKVFEAALLIHDNWNHVKNNCFVPRQTELALEQSIKKFNDELLDCTGFQQVSTPGNFIDKDMGMYLKNLKSKMSQLGLLMSESNELLNEAFENRREYEHELELV